MKPVCVYESMLKGPQIYYFVFYEDGRKQVIDSKKPLPLALLQKIVGGYIEIVRNPDPAASELEAFAIVDEEGLLKNRKKNPVQIPFVGTVILTSERGVK